MKSIPLLLGVLTALTSAAALHPRQEDYSTSTPTVTSTSSTASACTIDVIGNGHLNIEQSTCTSYASTVTYTSFTDCGGCSIRTIELGPGPVNRCTTWTTVDSTQTTVVACSPTAATL